MNGNKDNITNKKEPFLHARVTAELPFDLSIRPNLYPIKLPDSNATLKIHTLDASTVYGYSSSSSNSKILSKPSTFGIISNNDKTYTSQINSYIENSVIEKAVIFPANTILEIWIAFNKNNFPDDVSCLVNDIKIRKLIIFLINNFLIRYQVAIGFTTEAGKIGAISELELRQYSIQLFSDDTPKSKGHIIKAPLKSYKKENPVKFTTELEDRFKTTLEVPAIPLWLELAHNAHSLLHRGRNEESIINWFQSLEVAVGQISKYLKISGKPQKKTIEERLSYMLIQKGEEAIDNTFKNKITAVRLLRNKIIHEGKRLTFDDTQSEEVAETVINALQIIEELTAKHT